MKEERNIITIDEYGKLKMPSDKNGAVADIWMSEAELVELFGTTTGAVHGSIKASSKKTSCTITKSANTFVWKTETVRMCIIWRWLSPLSSG